VVAVAWVQREERRARVGCILAVIYERLVAPNDLRRVAAHDPCRSLVFGDAEELGMAWDDGVGEVGEARARHDMLVDADVLEVAERRLPPGLVHDVVVVRRMAAHLEVAEDRRAGRGAADHTAALEHFNESALTPGGAIVLHEMELLAALEPDATRLLEDGDHRVGVGDVAILGEEDDDILRTVQSPWIAGIGRHGVAAAGVWHIHDQWVRTAGRIDEYFVKLGPQRAAANHHDRAFGRSDLDGPAAKRPGLEGSVEGRGRRSGRRLCRERGGEAEEEELLDAHAFGHSKSEGGARPPTVPP